MTRARVEAKRARSVHLTAALVMATTAVALACVTGCSRTDGEEAGAATDAAVVDDRANVDEPYYPDASCTVAIDSPALLPAIHVAIGSDITWDSNPPSSGSHYPIWAAYQAYTSPVPRGYYVHDLEHGAVVLLYKCDPDAGTDCAAIAAQLQQVSDALPDDPLCTAAGGGVRVRTVITPDPLLDVPVAAAAWGWTYKAQCVDLPSLNAFAAAHYGQGPEVLCANGQAQF